MLGSLSNWLSNNLQLPLPKANEQQQKEEIVENKNKDDCEVITHQEPPVDQEFNVEEEKNKVETQLKPDEEKNINEKSEDKNNEFSNALNIDKQIAMDTAKEIGNFLLSFGKTASKQLQQTATQLKDVIEKNTIIGDFSKENEKFVNEKKIQQRREEAAVSPWIGYIEEDKLKQQILLLSSDSRNFLRNPPSGVEFQFDFNLAYPVALATLEEDPNLKEMRFKLVPKQVNEEIFWRNYFYRVSLIKQSTQLNQLASEHVIYFNDGENNDLTKDQINSSDTSKKKDELIDATASIDAAANNEFVSDSFDTSINVDEIKRDMKQLKLDKDIDDLEFDEEHDWDQELNEDIVKISEEEIEKELNQILQK